ncbi:MAG: putative alpha/beta hydrolase [Hyphomicrobiales bacterium]|nr:putative alpha/beta hydrolase [Hyphomicrobiales bacterium]
MNLVERMIALQGTELYLRDTGGAGQPVMLLHPASGSAMIWENQERALSLAGLRVLSYSRRGYWKSRGYDAQNPGIGSEDLLNLANALELTTFHLVGSAAGGSIAMDFALSQPERLRSLAIVNNAAGVRDGEIAAAAERIRPQGWAAMPVEFRELGPSYRATNPAGTQHWLELEHASLSGAEYRQKPRNRITERSLADLRVPTLFMTGDSDLIAPPPIVRMLADVVPKSMKTIVADAGHSIYWEQPGAFNEALAGFTHRHG